MYYLPKKDPKLAGIISAVSYGVAAVFYILGEFLKPRLVFQLAALVFVALGLFFTARYILTDYKYVLKDIERRGEETTFTVVKISGKREQIVASFDLLDAYAIEKCRKNSDFEERHGKVDKIYNYTSNLASPETHKLALSFNGMKVLLSIELSDEFAAEIRARMVADTQNGKNTVN